MFRHLAREYERGGERFPLPIGYPEEFAGGRTPEKYSELFLYHPVQLAGLLEAAWESRFSRFVLPLHRGSTVTGLPEQLLNLITVARPYTPKRPSSGGVTEIKAYNPVVVFDHLIYAYMIENTRIYEIFRKVLYEYLHGERLEVPSALSQRWLRTTEELFYRDTPPFFVFNLTSHIRPDIRASRRNAYYRMFGMDLTHGIEDSRPYPYEKPVAANREFVNVLEGFLQEVWRGIVNVTNQSGPNTTDQAAIANLAARLADMLNVRRQNGNLSREEFSFVATMSWFHLTVEFNSPIVKDLKAEGTNEAERLHKISERVGVPAHVKSHDFFSLADPLSRILIAIESEIFNNLENVEPLYAEDSPLRHDILRIITSWSSATGRNIKGEHVTASPARGLPSVATPAVPATPNSAAPVPAPRP